MPTKSKTKPTKLPTKTIVADDLEVEVDGEKFYPHAGESVTYRVKNLSLDNYLVQMKALSLQFALPEAAVDNKLDYQAVINLEEAAHKVLALLASQIVSWDWTDDLSEPYPSPPTPEILRTLSREEMRWLDAHINPIRPEPTKNGQAPST